jgi:hypothetical protein
VKSNVMIENVSSRVPADVLIRIWQTEGDTQEIVIVNESGPWWDSIRATCERNPLAPEVSPVYGYRQGKRLTASLDLTRDVDALLYTLGEWLRDGTL